MRLLETINASLPPMTASPSLLFIAPAQGFTGREQTMPVKVEKAKQPVNDPPEDSKDAEKKKKPEEDDDEEEEDTK